MPQLEGLHLDGTVEPVVARVLVDDLGGLDGESVSLFLGAVRVELLPLFHVGLVARDVPGMIHGKLVGMGEERRRGS